MTNTTASTWRKSSYSGTQGQCVEVRNDLSAVRDSKNPAGAELVGDLGRLIIHIKGLA